MGWDAGSASSAAGVQLLGHEQLDWDVVAGDPRAGLVDAEVVEKASGSHHVLEARVVVEAFGHDGEIGVDGVRCDRDVAVAGVQVDGLCSDEHERVELGAERFEGVQQRAARDGGLRRQRHGLRRASSLVRIHSMSALPSAGMRPGPVRRSTAICPSAT